ncbi:MAG: hypothetical protein Q9164_007578 [Protoblastenia rupestris]
MDSDPSLKPHEQSWEKFVREQSNAPSQSASGVVVEEMSTHKSSLEQPWKVWLKDELSARQEAENSPEKMAEQERLRQKQEDAKKPALCGLDNASG